MPHIVQTLADTDAASFCAGTEDPAALRRQLEGSLRVGSTRPAWCWLAVDPTGRVLARNSWWGRHGAMRPIGVDLVSAEDHDAAVALLLHARDHLELHDAWCCITAPVEAGEDPSVTRAHLVAVLTACDFAFAVSRVRVAWRASLHGAAPPNPGRLIFRPADSLTDELLVSLFSAVGDGSLDHGMVTDRARLGAEGEARHRLERARSYRAEPGWFQVAFTPEGDPAGYVVPGFADETPMIGEIGVAAGQRGNGYVSDLLDRATRLLASSGAQRIVADTDRGNTPMRAAFARAGYREVGWRDDYRWQRGTPPGAPVAATSSRCCP